MCGIVVSYLKKNLINPHRFEKSLTLIKHRGPDSLSLHISEDKHLALGHARLSIMDLEHGTQPFFSDDGMLVSIINGEFYDFKKIRQNLIKQGYTFKTNSDSEILLPLYLEYGLDCLQHLRGEFSFIIWDKRQNILFSARDRLGIKPLYYCFENDNLHIASEIKSILALGVPAIWNEETVYYSNHGIYQQERTCFKGIYSIKPGHFVLYNLNKNELKSIKYWDLNYSKPERLDHYISDKEYFDEFRKKITEAVQIRLNSDVSYACYLSGGIDSTAVLALAASINAHPIDAFTIAFPNRPIDELDLAQRTAKYLGANHYVVNATEKEMVDILPESIWHGESLVCNTHGASLFLLSKLVHQTGHKVVLTGGGADETLFGYEFFREDVIRHNLLNAPQNSLNSLLQKLRESSIAPGMTVTSDEGEYDLQGFDDDFSCIPTLLSIYMTRGNRFSKFYHRDFLSSMSQSHPIMTFMDDIQLKQQRGLDVLSLSSYMFSKSSLPGYILSTIGDKIEMANSIEGRVPFLDHKFVEFTQKIPNHLKINNLVEKYILRESLKDILPPWIYNRSKQPFFSPESSGELYAFMGEIFHSDMLKNSPFYCQKNVLSFYEQYNNLDYKSRIAADHLMTEIMSSCLMQQAFNLQTSHLAHVNTAVVEL